jgi:hypothetical protein
MIAATSVLAIGGSLALAGSASAVPIPWGASTDTGSTTVYGLYNQASPGLIQAQNLIVLANGISQGGGGAPVDSGFPTAFTAATSLTAANVAEIATDVSASANTSILELATCVSGFLTAASLPPTPTNVTGGATYCKGNQAALNAAATTFTGTVQPAVVKAAASWPQLSSLLTMLQPFPGTLYSIDGNVSVRSAATVAAKGAATSYSITAAVNGAAASGGYVLPSGFTMTFPNAFTVNTSLASAELPVADEASPPTAKAIGTVTVATPVASEFGGANGKITGGVYVINAIGNITQPDLELWFGPGIYLLGTFPKTLAFPLTLTFGKASVAGAPDPIPFSSLAINFPAKTSPVKALSCTNLGQVGGSATDEVAGLAAQFGDTTDGFAATGTTPVALASTRTVVTNLCAPTTGKTTITGIKNGLPAVNIMLKGNGGSKFSNAVITLPTGITAKGLKAKDLKVSGAKLKSVKASGAKVTVTFKSATKSATVNFAKGLSVSKKLKTAVTKKKTKSLAIKFTVKYATAASTAGSVTVKKLS